MKKNIVIIGGGIAGLVAANQAARAGADVVLVEKAASLGGRAATRERNGYFFNLGPHALYRSGTLRRTLRAFDIEPTGKIPGGNGGFALFRGQRHTLPAGFTSLVTTGLLSLSEKMEFAKLLSTIGAIDAAAVQDVPLASWLTEHIGHERVRDVIRMLVRVTTFTNDPTRQSAGAAIEQLQLAVKGNVLYLDRGWQTLVDALRAKAVAGGVNVRSTACAVALEHASRSTGLQACQGAPIERRRVMGVCLADGTRIAADAVIITGAPADVDALANTTFAAELPPPVRLATLDIALRSLPNRRRLVAFGVDAPVYFSVHSAAASLAPAGGALLHVSQYLGPDQQADHRVEAALEALVDDLQPGWRQMLETKYFRPNLTVTNAEVTAAQGGVRGRPSVRLDEYDNVFIAGDWVGARGQLSDAAAASAIEAAEAALKGCATEDAGRVLLDPASGGSTEQVAQAFRPAVSA
jgi:phytoene dehydrogenase-like protein